jgi:hypothetical protein
MRAVILLWANAQQIDVFRWALDSWEYMSSMMAIRQGDWGHYMFILRPPGYPLILSGFNGLFGTTPPQMVTWLPFQAALTAIGTVVAVHILYRVTQRRDVALIGGILLAIDPIILGAEVPLLSEALFNPALLVAQLFLLRWLCNHRWSAFLICILALQVMVLMRPIGIYVVVIFVIVILFNNWKYWPYGIVMVLGFSVPIFLWTARNSTYTGINTYSTATVYNLLFYKAISTESMVMNTDPDELAWNYAREIETRLGNPNALDTRFFPVGNYTYLYVDNPARYKVMSDMANEKLAQFHVWHFVKLPYTFLRDFVSNETLRALIPAPVQWLITIVYLIIVPLGIWKWFKQSRPRWQHILVLGMTAYFMLGSAFMLPGNTASRYFSPVMVYWLLLFILGIMQFNQILKPIYDRVPRPA